MGLIGLEDDPDASRCMILGISGQNGMVVVVTNSPQMDDAESEHVGLAALSLLALSHANGGLYTARSEQETQLPSAQTSMPEPSSPRPALTPQFPALAPQFSEADLIAANQAIGASHRPVKIYSFGEGGFVGYPAAYTYTVTPHMLFANGNLVKCSEWDPSKFDPTPQSLAPIDDDYDCDVVKWRKRNGRYERYDADENAFVEIEDLNDPEYEQSIGFKPGTNGIYLFGRRSLLA